VSDANPTPPEWEAPPSKSPANPWATGPSPTGAGSTGAYPGPRPAPYGPDPYASAVAPPPEPQRPVVELADIWTVVLGTISVLIVGVIATFIWVWVAPRVIAVKDAKGGVSLAAPESKSFAGADVTFFFVTLGAGILCGLVAALVARHRGLAVTVAMAGGGILSSLMVAWLGRWLTGGPLHRWADNASTGSHHLFIQLQTRPFIMIWPVAALVITFIVALATPDRPPAEPPRHAAH
jgi:hypothetical protein